MSTNVKPPVPEIPHVEAVPRRRSSGPALNTVSLSLRTIAPVLGGGAVTRRVEREGPVRVPGIRGQLRFWWRALHVHEHETPAELARREAELWGGMGRDREQPKRSLVDVWVQDAQGRPDEREVRPGMPGFYALWPARGQRKGERVIEDEAERWAPDLRFRLCVRAPRGQVMEDVQRTLRAWLLFGGIGSRTRRGLGSLTVVDGDRREWLPVQPTQAELARLLGRNISFAGDRPWEQAHDTPALDGALLHWGKAQSSGELVWQQALGWLSEFRQGAPKPGSQSDRRYAREPAPKEDPQRPGRSHWPEPDKVRLLSGKDSPWTHEIVHTSETMAWPRASFGLPIVGQFQQQPRKRDPGPRYVEPDNFEIRWRIQGEPGTRDRLASPLIVKAMPLADGQCVPVALWLFRGYPRDAEVVLCRKGEAVDHSAAPFDKLHAEGDPVLYEPLRQSTMREAFTAWLRETNRARSIDP
jgi:CRISPR-associated protein Cmr1